MSTEPTSEPVIAGLTASGRRFQIHSCLGRGGFGEVYRATMASSGGVRTEVAIKVLRGDIDPGSDSVKRLRDEGRLLGALRHPSILRVHDLVLLEDRVALVTEFVEGDDLDRCMKPTMPIRSLVGVIGEVAAALDVAWNAPSPNGGEAIHLVHRDVKPANIRIGRHGEVKLLDFGIARATNVVREAQTANNAMMGSYLYMSPERFHEEKVEPPSDVYALGCILYEGITGVRLFDGMSLKQIYGTMLLTRKFTAHLAAKFELLPPDVDPVVRQLMTEMLAADPAARPTATEVARRCEDLVEVLGGATLKRWARSREWATPEQILGTLDGRELTAQSFGMTPARSIEETFVQQLPEPEPEPEPEAFHAAGTTGSLALPPIDLAMPALGTYAETPAPTVRRSSAPSAPPEPSPPIAWTAPRPAEPAAETLAPLDTPAAVEPRAPEAPAAAPAVPVAPAPSPPAAVPVAAPAGVAAAVAAPPPVPSGIATVVPQPSTATPDPRPRAARPPELASEPALGDLLGASTGNAGNFDPITDPNIDPMPGVLEVPVSAHVTAEEDFDRQLIEMQERARRRNLMLGVGGGVAVVVVLLLAAVGFAVSQLMGGATTDAGSTAEVARDPSGGLTPVTAPEPTPTPAPVATAAPLPSPEPRPAPAAPRPAPSEPRPAPTEPRPEPTEPRPAPASGNAAQLVEQGWNTVDRDPTKALTLFDQAVQIRPDAESWYGYGYTLMQLGRKAEAQSALCKAVTMGSASLQREIKSVMSEKDLTCP